MSSRKSAAGFCIAVIVCLSALPSAAQEDRSNTPTLKPSGMSVEGQDPIKISVEEVRIPLTAHDESGRFDPTVGIDDLMVREDGVVQQLKSLYRIPASVALLLDTGGELNVAKDIRLTREVAIGVVSNLHKDDSTAVVQVNARVELVQDWTTDRTQAIKSLNNKLLSGKRSALAEGILAAVALLERMPAGNRHLVLVSDGIDSPGGRVELDDALKNLVEANVTVHIISYTTLGRKAKRPSVSRPREKSQVPEEIIMSLPRTHIPGDGPPDIKEHLEMKGGAVLDIDRLFRRGKDVKKTLKLREEEFAELADETGGGWWLPGTAAEMIAQARAVAREVDAQYVISYRPQRPLAADAATEYRKIDVLSRRTGLRVRSRRGYVVRLAGQAD